MTKSPDWKKGEPGDLSVFSSSGTPPGTEATNGVSRKEHWIEEPDLNTNFFCYKKKNNEEESRLKSKSVRKQQTAPLCFLHAPLEEPWVFQLEGQGVE